VKSVFLCIFIFLTGLCFSNEQDPEKTFTWFYNEGKWGRNGKGESVSGKGSEYKYAKPFVNYVKSLIHKHRVTSIVDLGCGDWELMRRIDLEDIQYLGLECVRELVTRNNRKYSKKNIQFKFGDILSMKYPKADLLICKDVMIHLSNQQIKKIISQFSNFKYVLVVNSVYTSTGTSQNNDIQMGQFRPVDISKPPFNVNGIKVCKYRLFHKGYSAMIFLVVNE
jgi:hypothetical protein